MISAAGAHAPAIAVSISHTGGVTLSGKESVMRIGDRSGHLARRRWRVVSMAVLGVAGIFPRAAQAGHYFWGSGDGTWYSTSGPAGHWTPVAPATGYPQS